MIFEKSFASHPKSKFWSKKNNDKPINIAKSSHNKYIFNCETCEHEFESNLNNITNSNNWCPFCSNRKICENDDCKMCFINSFASHPKSKFWSKENEILPRQIFKNSKQKFKCCHVFITALYSITTNNSWCPYCCKPQLILCDKENCKKCFNKSFASHEKFIYWSNKNKLNPRHIFKSSGKKYFFNCNICNHIFESTLNNITNNNNWCSYCSNQKLCENEDCKDCFNKSFASNKKFKFWSNKNNLEPREVFKGSSKKYLFDCNTCNNEFKSELNHVSHGRWCPFCKYKTELKLFNWLKLNFPKLLIERQVRFNWCKKQRELPFDFVLNKLIIELDGSQHFKQVSNWQSPEKTQINDKFKNKLALENGYKIIRISQEIVLNDLENWENKLTKAIKNKKKLVYIGNIYNIIDL